MKNTSCQTFRDVTQILGISNLDVASIFGLTRQGVSYWYRDGNHTVSKDVAEWLQEQEIVFANCIWFFLALQGWPTDQTRKFIMRRFLKEMDSPLFADSKKFATAAEDFLKFDTSVFASCIPAPQSMADFHFFFPPLRLLYAASIGPYTQAVAFAATISGSQILPCSIQDYKDWMQKEDGNENRIKFLAHLVKQEAEEE